MAFLPTLSREQLSCYEPWIEVAFGTLPPALVKLTNRPNAVSDLGTPEQLLQRIWAFITVELAASYFTDGPLLTHGLQHPDLSTPTPRLPGTHLEEDDYLSSSVVELDGRTHYCYELYAPAANEHSITAVTAKVCGTCGAWRASACAHPGQGAWEPEEHGRGPCTYPPLDLSPCTLPPISYFSDSLTLSMLGRH